MSTRGGSQGTSTEGCTANTGYYSVGWVAAKTMPATAIQEESKLRDE